MNLSELNGKMDYMDWQPGPCTRKMMLLVREIYRKSGALVDAVFHIPGWLEEAGFINIHTELSGVPMGGQEGKEMRDNKCAAYAAMKTPALKAGGFGFINSEEEYDDMVQAMREELIDTVNASVQTYMIFAQKPLA